MSREKQIEERIMQIADKNMKKSGHAMSSIATVDLMIEQAKREVAEEIFEEIETILRTLDKQHMLCGNPKQAWGVRSVETKLAELKKKYIGKDTNVTTNTEE